MKPTQEQSDGLVEVVFTCPHCGCPYATFKEKSIDLHAGACYTCGECGNLVTFVAEKIPYERKPTSPDALAEAVKALERIRDVCEYASRHAHGMYGFTKYVEAHGTVTATVQEALQKIATLDAAGGDTND